MTIFEKFKQQLLAILSGVLKQSIENINLPLLLHISAKKNLRKLNDNLFVISIIGKMVKKWSHRISFI